jgi:hypothetical protein
VQLCTKCQHESSDSVNLCENCDADLSEFSTISVALKRLLENPRIKSIGLAISHDACPACSSVQGTYEKGEAPLLPVKGCSHPLGCRCFYEPVIEIIYP